MDFSLQLAIAFFGVQVAAWAGLILYIRAAHLRRVESAITKIVAESHHEPVAQAA